MCTLPCTLSFPWRVTHNTFLPSAVKIQQHVCIVSAWGSPLDPQCPRILLGASHLGNPCLAHTKSTLPEESRCSTSTSWFAQTIKAQWQWEDSWSPSFQVPAVGQPCKQAFLRMAVLGLHVNSSVQCVCVWRGKVEGWRINVEYSTLDRDV